MIQNAHNDLIITAGEPAGIGPEVILKAFANSIHNHPAANPLGVVVGDIEMLEERSRSLGLNIDIVNHRLQTAEPHQLPVIHIANQRNAIPSKLDPENSTSVIAGINLAIDLCLSGEFKAMVTAPVHKGIINDAGIAFSGHTEWIAQRCQAPLPVMMLTSNSMRVCLATTHLPLIEVSNAITPSSLTEIIEIMHRDIARLYRISSPRIGVCGLNPHAGEGGHLGTEEIQTIAPVIEIMKNKGMNICGPIPADTAFTQRSLDNLDAVLCMYHDQGLPVIKHRDFGDVVNVTLGLPIIRTSVDHGTALDIAGSAKANEASFESAVQLAHRFVDLNQGKPN